MGRSVSTPMANTTQSMTRCDNLQTRCPARPVSNRACSITAGEITLLRPASRSTTVSASGVGSKQLPCRIIVIASLKPGFYTHPRLQEATTCAKTNGIGLKPGGERCEDAAALRRQVRLSLKPRKKPQTCAPDADKSQGHSRNSSGRAESGLRLAYGVATKFSGPYLFYLAQSRVRGQRGCVAKGGERGCVAK